MLSRFITQDPPFCFATFSAAADRVVDMSQFIQDHKAVVIGNKKVAQANAAKSGEAKKPGSTGLNGKLDNQTASKLDDNEVKAPRTVGIEVGQAIQRARASKKLKVDQLANEMALTVSRSLMYVPWPWRS